jgi:hypothetical protein
MRLLPIFFAAIFASQSAQSQPTGDAGKAEDGSRAREIALDNLLSERESDKALASVISAARKAGISEQAILEARFLYHVDRREDDAIAAMLPEFMKQREIFNLKESEIFGVKEDWLAVIEYVQAIDCLKKEDKDGFKSHITEAFWLSPRQASAFAPHIERMRLEEAMRNVKIDLAIKLLPVAPGNPVTLESLLAGKKALLVHFWSPANRESEDSLPDFIATAAALESHGIAVASLLPDDSPKLIDDARKLIQPAGSLAPGAWLIDAKETPLARDLRVQALPLFALISNKGTVLFNGDPTDEGFWEAMSKIDPQIVRPKIQEGGE